MAAVEHALDAKPAPFLLGKGAGIAAVAACSDHLGAWGVNDIIAYNG